MASTAPVTTTLSKAVLSGDTFIPLASMVGVVKGYVLFVDLEAMPIAQLIATGAIPGVVVTRTGRAASHGPGSTVYIGPPASFATVDPVGVPPAGSQPWIINTQNGRIWIAQGDEAGPGAANRWWQLQATVYGRGALGIRTTVVAPTTTVQ